jgi:hypothetical protein
MGQSLAASSSTSQLPVGYGLDTTNGPKDEAPTAAGDVLDCTLATVLVGESNCPLSVRLNFGYNHHILGRGRDGEVPWVSLWFYHQPKLCCRYQTRVARHQREKAHESMAEISLEYTAPNGGRWHGR